MKCEHRNEIQDISEGRRDLTARGESETPLFNSQFTRLCHLDPERSRRGGICILPRTADPSLRSG
jgi:hypothetical protein